MENNKEKVNFDEKKDLAIGRITPSLCHKLNNILAGSLLFLRLTRKKLDFSEIPKDKCKSYLEKVEGEINRSTILLKKLLDFSRNGPAVKKNLNLNDILEDSILLAEHYALVNNVQLIAYKEENLPCIISDEKVLQQIFLTIIISLVDKIKTGGEIKISTFCSKNRDEVAFSLISTEETENSMMEEIPGLSSSIENYRGSVELKDNEIIIKFKK